MWRSLRLFAGQASALRATVRCLPLKIRVKRKKDLVLLRAATGHEASSQTEYTENKASLKRARERERETERGIE